MKCLEEYLAYTERSVNGRYYCYYSVKYLLSSWYLLLTFTCTFLSSHPQISIYTYLNNIDKPLSSFHGIHVGSWHKIVWTLHTLYVEHTQFKKFEVRENYLDLSYAKSYLIIKRSLLIKNKTCSPNQFQVFKVAIKMRQISF